jgi:uncharacterized membrane protein YphA (DoxX/SURF4 family)
VDTAGVVTSVVLGVVFVVAGATKVIAGPAWASEAREMGAPDAAIPAVPWVEIVLGAVLVVQLAPVAAAVVAIVLLTVFTALIVRQLAAGRRPPCACFGAWSRRPLGPVHVVRNVVLLGFAAVALFA